MPIDSTTYENAYTSALEVFLFGTQPPERVFCYPSKSGSVWHATTWMGDDLGRSVLHEGRIWRDNFGGERQSVSFIGLSGHWYHGTRYMGTGDYIRAKRGKLAR